MSDGGEIVKLPACGHHLRSRWTVYAYRQSSEKYEYPVEKETTR